MRLLEAGGHGQPLVLVHGWGGEAAQWRALVPALAARYRVFAAELPGGPQIPLDGPIDMRALGAGLAAALDVAALSDVLLVGHSMGGPVIVEAAIAAPRRVAGLLGLDTLADRAFYGGSDADEIVSRNSAFEADLPGQTRAMIDAIAAPGTSDALRQAICAGALRARPADLLALRAALFAWRAGARVPKLAVPLRLLNSSAVVAAHACDPLPCLAQVPQACYGAGHFPHIEGPEQLLPLILAELDQIGAG